MDEVDPIRPHIAEIYFNNPKTLITGLDLARKYCPPHATRTLDYTSYFKMSYHLMRDMRYYKPLAVIYDNEGWWQTPKKEQKYPAFYEFGFAQLLHFFGVGFISAPATTLPIAGRSAQGYLNAGVAASAAAVLPHLRLDIQAQELLINTTPEEYQAFVSAALKQARTANPDVTILAGLTTFSDPYLISAEQLRAAIDATDGDGGDFTVEGYWLNITHNLNASAAVELLRTMYAQSPEGAATAP
jgi:hypothetical protein